MGGLALDEPLTWAASLDDGYAGVLTIIEAVSFPASLTATLVPGLDINGAASYGATITLNTPLAGVISTGVIPRAAGTPATPRAGGTVTAEGGSAGAATGRSPATPATTR